MACAIAMRADQFERAPILESAAQTRGTAAELRAINAPRDGEIRMGVHVVSAPVAIDAIDAADMAVHVVDNRAGTDRAGRQRGRIEIREDAALLGSIGAVG